VHELIFVNGSCTFYSQGGVEFPAGDNFCKEKACERLFFQGQGQTDLVRIQSRRLQSGWERIVPWALKNPFCCCGPAFVRPFLTSFLLDLCVILKKNTLSITSIPVLIFFVILDFG